LYPLTFPSCRGERLGTLVSSFFQIPCPIQLKILLTLTSEYVQNLASFYTCTQDGNLCLSYNHLLLGQSICICFIKYANNCM
uniref:Uncharacterized protein n=1 Tax=Mustela putorius furo TaxID=9669 RepID=M3YGR9_MUSPF